MSSDNVVNFRKAKKKIARADKEKSAEENRIKFGRTKAQKLADKAAKDKAAKHIDDHKREP